MNRRRTMYVIDGTWNHDLIDVIKDNKKRKKKKKQKGVLEEQVGRTGPLPFLGRRVDDVPCFIFVRTFDGSACGGRQHLPRWWSEGPHKAIRIAEIFALADNEAF